MTGAAMLDALLADGRVVQIRPIEPADAPRLVAFHEALSPETTRYRFFTVHPRLSESELERFTHVDHHSREALIALLDGALVGVARYIQVEGTTEAEVAFVVS